MSRDIIYKLKVFGIYTGVTVLVGLVFKYMLPIVAPFVVGFLLAYLLDKPTAYLEEKFHIPKTIFVILFLIFFAAVLGLLIYFGGKILVKELCNLADRYEKYLAYFGGVKKICDRAMDCVVNQTANFLGIFTRVFTGMAVTIMVVLFVAKDMKKIKERLNRAKLFVRLRDTIGSFFKTELIIMTITSGICTIGLYALKNPYALLLGILIGLIDALPILGTGTVFLPWTTVLVFLRNYKTAIFLFVIYLICYYTRQFLEPKLMGNKMGVSPLMMLFAIYVGLKLFGVIGVFTGPIALILIKEIAEILKKLVEPAD